MLPEDWRTQLGEVVRGTSAPDPSWFTGSATLTPGEQIGIYQEQYHLRMTKALDEDIPGVRHLLGAQAEEVLERYLADRPTPSWTLNHLAYALPEWLDAQGAPIAVRDMACLEVAVARSFVARDPKPLDPGSLRPDSALQLTPPTSILRLHSDVHRVRAELRAGDTPLPPAPSDARVLVYRRHGSVRHTELEPEQYALLDAFSEGSTLAAVIDSVPDVDPAAVGRWFKGFAERGLLEVVQARP
ncbi:MAG: putative DNA-binding domain-containing protein [Deltaproteobacteria bacterium]|nr:putative DNA-binding domain-containing protein [Deltaproteobacteria bacterium]MBW2254026.1 putative DNA-binding domain-containing protein [Deltaproteobacteria bacterium]